MAAGNEIPAVQGGGATAGTAGRHRAMHVMTTTALIAIVMVLSGAAVAVTLPPPPDELDRLYPLDPGTTWVYDVVSGAEASGRRYDQVLNAGQHLEVEGGTEARAVQQRYDVDPVTGEPSRRIAYLAHRGDRLLLLGERDATGYLQNFPARLAYQASLTPGASWTWINEFDEQDTVTTTLVAVESVSAAGTTFADCQHLQRTRTSSFADPAVTREWVCPGVGPVRRVDEALGTEETLVAYRSAGQAIGAAAVFTPAEPSDGVAVIGADPGGSQSAAGSLDTTQPLWTASHSQIVQFPPLLRGQRLVLANEAGDVWVTQVDTGEVLWRNQVPAPVVAAPVLSGDVILVADASGALRGLDLTTGATVWWRPLPAIVTALNVDGTTAVVAGRDRTVRGVNISDGSVRWERRIPGITTAVPAVSNGLAVVGDETGAVTAVFVADGSVVWERSVEGPVTAGPSIGAGGVTIGDDTSTLTRLNLQDGSLVWSRYVDGGVVFSPAVTDDAVVALGSERLRSYDVQTGEQRWESDVTEEVATPPLVIGDEVVVLSADTHLLRFSLGDGRLTGSSPLPRPDETGGVRAVRPMAVSEDTLLVMFEATPPFPFTFVVAYPLAGQAATGVHFTGEFFAASGAPVSRVQSSGGELVVANELGGVEVVSAAGPPRTLLDAGGVAPYAVLAGDVVVAQKDQELLAVPLAGGEPLWRVPVGEPLLGSTAVVAGDVVVAPAAGGAELIGVDLATGERRWSLQTGTAGPGRPLLLPDGDVAFGSGGLVRIDPATGIERWRVDGVEALAPMAVARDSIVVGGTVDGENALLAVDAADGTQRWRYDFQVNELTGPAAAGDLVIVADASGFVGAADAVSGEVAWTAQLSTPPSATPAVLGDVVILGEQGRSEDFNSSEDRYLALDSATGQYLGSYQPFASTPSALYPAFTALDDERIALWHLPDVMVLRVRR